MEGCILIQARSEVKEVEQCENTLTVNELIDVLKQYDGNSSVFIKNCDGFSFAGLLLTI